MANRVWVFDLDGTLMDTLDLYRKPAEEAYTLIMRKLGDHSPSFNEIKERHSILDKEMIYQKDPDTGKLYLFTKKRFPTSLVKIYEILCKEAGIEPSFLVMRKIYRIGLKAFNQERYRRKIKPQAFMIAQFLKKRGDILFILTKGDRRIQGDKRRALKEAGLLKFFKAFIIVPDDKGPALKSIKETYPDNERYCIGDTYKADIMPGIKWGFFGVYIPSNANWMEVGRLKWIEQQRSKRRSNRYANLMEIAEKYDYL
ncbi:MAG: HAD family hydrolase [Candidatus Harrisonbacteria bacterium]|nr:HAD family hydrolase [Candidatus Harrisonbacteria bacterium]